MELLNYKNNNQSIILPETALYFKEELASEILNIPIKSPDVESVLDILIWPEVENISIVDTPIATSNEGQHLTGVKLSIELNLKEKITYVSCSPNQSVHSQYFETIKSLFVVVPQEIGNKSIYDLLRCGQLNVTPYIETINYRELDCRNIYQCALIFVNVVLG